MKKVATVTGWALRASALTCMVWIVTGVLGGRIDTLSALASSVVWHAGFALSGVALVGAGGPKAVAQGSAAPAAGGIE